MEKDNAILENQNDIHALPDKEALKVLRSRKPARKRVRHKSLSIGDKVSDSVAAIGLLEESLKLK